MGKLTSAKYRFEKHDQIGAAAAEQDEAFLADCFVDAGDLAVLEDCRDRRRIVLGRTGTGKTALLQRLAANAEHVVEIPPEHLSLSYLSNSTMLPYLVEIGVDLDQFYRLLWRHVFAVELIKERFGITSEKEKKSFLERLYERFHDDKRKKRAMEYLVSWGESFWEQTEYRVQEVTSKLEADVRASLGAKFRVFDAAVNGSRKLTEEERKVFCEQAQAVVNSIQIRDLFEVVDLLSSDLLHDPKHRIYILVDRLDENWIDDRFRYRLVRALIETVGEFTKVQSAKIVVALRRDLIDRVIRDTRSTGFQEEKYRDLYLEISWTREQLMEVLDRRINKLVRRSYTKEMVRHEDLLPNVIDGQPLDDYLLERTLYRPRDIILFFNHCIKSAIEQQRGKPSIPVSVLKVAERGHARDRLRSLADEWYSNFPDLMEFTEILKKRPSSFRLREIGSDQIEELCLRVVVDSTTAGPLVLKARDVVENLLSTSSFKAYLIRVFYQVGLVGLKPETFEKTQWSFLSNAVLPAAEVGDDNLVSVWPVFFAALGITPVHRAKA